MLRFLGSGGLCEELKQVVQRCYDESAQLPLAAQQCCWLILLLLSCILGTEDSLLRCRGPYWYLKQAVQHCWLYLFSAYRAPQASLAAQHLRLLRLPLPSWTLGMEVARLGQWGVCEELKQVAQLSFLFP